MFLESMQATFFKKWYALLMVAAVEAAPVVASATSWTWINALISTVLALIGGGFVQLTRAENDKLTQRQAIGEWMLCGVMGFVIHAPAVERFSDSIGMVWTVSVLAGCAGSKAIDMYCEKFIRP